MFKMDKKNMYIIRGIIVFIIFYFSAYFQLIPIKLFNLDTSKLDMSMKVILSTFSSICVFIIFFFIYRKDLRREFNKFRKNFLENIDVGFKYWIVGLIIMMGSNLIITYVFKVGGAHNENAVQSMVHALPWMMIFTAGFIAPFNEEIVFRKTLKDVIKSKWLFALCSFLLFGGAHVISSATSLMDYLYIIPYGALGGAFALAYYESDTVFTTISMHMIHNTILVLLSILVL